MCTRLWTQVPMAVMTSPGKQAGPGSKLVAAGSSSGVSYLTLILLLISSECGTGTVTGCFIRQIKQQSLPRFVSRFSSRLACELAAGSTDWQELGASPREQCSVTLAGCCADSGVPLPPVVDPPTAPGPLVAALAAVPAGAV